MADHVNRGFELADGDREPTGWTRTGLAVRDVAGYLHSENLLTRSYEFDHASWTTNESTINPDASAPPSDFSDLGNVADELIDNANLALHYVQQNVAAAIGLASTLSVYAKAGAVDWVYVYLESAGGVWFNVNTGVIGSDTGTIIAKEIVDAGSGWYRCSVTATPGGSGGARIMASATDGGTTYSGASTAALTLFGAQLSASYSLMDAVLTIASAIRNEQGFEDYELFWVGSEGYFSTIASAGSTAAEYDVAGVDDVAYEAYEEEWSSNESYLFAPGPSTSASYDVGTPENWEDYEEEWDGNEVYYLDIASAGSTAADYDTTPEAYEDYEEDWDDNQNYLTSLGAHTNATYDTTVPEPYEDYEEEWSLMATI